MDKYALLNTAHPDFSSIIVAQGMAFDALQGATNYGYVSNLAGTQAFTTIYAPLPASACVLNSNFLPATRTMSEWEVPKI